MVILYIYLTCWCMKSVFYERQQWWASPMQGAHIEQGGLVGGSPKRGGGVEVEITNGLQGGTATTAGDEVEGCSSGTLHQRGIRMAP
jgi:hypothetical protein